MGDRPITFDPTNKIVREFLLNIGLPDAVIDSGVVTPEDAQKNSVNHVNLSAIAGEVRDDSIHTADDILRDAFILSQDEADIALKLIAKYRHRAANLFRRDKCPGASNSSEAILNNMLGHGSHFNPLTVFNVVRPSEACPYDPAYSLEELSDIHFTEAAVSKRMRDTGRSVVVIKSADGNGQEKQIGSGVIISSDGTILTARHVLYNKETGKLEKGLFALIEGRRYSVDETNIADHYKRDAGYYDLVLLKIDTPIKMPAIKIAEHVPLKKEAIWVIGFPGMMNKDDLGKRTYTLGRIKMAVIINGEMLAVSTTAHVAGGDSGGAIVNSKGELVGIVCLSRHRGKFNAVANLQDSSWATLPLRFVKGWPIKTPLY